MKCSIGSQTCAAPKNFSYSCPSIAKVYPNHINTDGGRVSNNSMFIVGSSLGYINKEWKLSIGPFKVNSSEVLNYNATHIEFFPPPGQGLNLTIDFEVGGLKSCGKPPIFNYNPPIIYSSYTDDSDRNTNGKYNIHFLGESLGHMGCDIMIRDVFYNESLQNGRMPPTPCRLVSQNDDEIICEIPPGIYP